MKEEKFYYWKYHTTEQEPERMIWIWPITKEEMKEDFDEFRHNKYTINGYKKHLSN